MNKKFLKSILFIAAICMVLSFSVKDVYAEQATGYKCSPEFQASDIATSQVYNLRSSSAEVYGNQMFMYFHRGSTRCGRGFVNIDARKIWIALWEDDEHPNADEKIKLYSGQFSCGTPSNFTLVKTCKAGKVETNSVVETYMRCEIDKNSADDGRAIVPMDLFRYNIYVK